MRQKSNLEVVLSVEKRGGNIRIRRAADCAPYLPPCLPKWLIFRRLTPFLTFFTLFLSWKELISRRLHVFARKFFFGGYEEL
jgi:hypothetical protein